MAVDSFTSAATVAEQSAPVQAPAPRVRASKITKKRKPKAERRLVPQVISLLDDRIEDALVDGRIELLDADIPFKSLELTANELVALWRILFADEPDQAEASLRTWLEKRQKK